MIPGRIIQGRCSFAPPEGFVPVVMENPVAIDDAGCTCGAGEPVCVILTSERRYGSLPELSECPEDMMPAAYPAGITLITQQVGAGHCPMDYLKNSDDVLQGYYEGFRSDFYTRGRVGEHTAALSQSSFMTNFRIFWLNIAWRVGGEFVVSTMTVSGPGLEKGWLDLVEFAGSVRFRFFHL